jgi:hypothetical protein
MAKAKRPGGSQGAATAWHPPGMKFFRPVSWYDARQQSSGEFISYLSQELGRLGLRINDIESNDRPPNTRTVFSDLINWVSHPGEALSKLFNWQDLDLNQIQSRLAADPSAKPRIEVSAQITKMNNLSVRWHPGGWRESAFDWGNRHYDYSNLIMQRKWKARPDFLRFLGDEEPTYSGRATNELMYIRGVGNLDPKPRAQYGPYATFNDDVVDSVLICAVRSAYEELVEQLKYGFEVEVVDGFDFVIRDEPDSSARSQQYPIHRVIQWTLEDAANLATRRETEAAAARYDSERSELSNVQATYGFEIEVLIASLARASSKKATGPAPSQDSIDRQTSKALRDMGFKIHAGQVARIRQLMESHCNDRLPEALRRSSNPRTETGPSVKVVNNVVSIRDPKK